MSEIITKFYNLFWKDKPCQNLFLLSKEELLDTTSFGEEPDVIRYSSPRIIISNARDNDEFDTIKIRTENQNINLDVSIDSKIEYFKPIIEQMFNTKFKKSLDKLVGDFETKGLSILLKIIKILANEKTREKNSIAFLQDYGFIGKHIHSFKEIEKDLENQFKPKKGNELINEQTISTFFEGIKYFKELYVNHSYKKLYSTNQILTNSLHSLDNFESRLILFHKLYETEILSASKEDAFIECSHCEPGTYRGVFQLKVNPKKLKDLKCPVCSRELTYFVPYDLHPEIFNVVKHQDGILLDAYCNLLVKNKLAFITNRKFLTDIEIDCIFEKEGRTYIVESKMYKQNDTSTAKIKSKIRRHFGKLIDDVSKLQSLAEFSRKELMPILLVNIIDSEFIRDTEFELKASVEHQLVKNARILSISIIQNN